MKNKIFLSIFFIALIFIISCDSIKSKKFTYADYANLKDKTFYVTSIKYGFDFYPYMNQIDVEPNDNVLKTMEKYANNDYAELFIKSFDFKILKQYLEKNYKIIIDISDIENDITELNGSTINKKLVLSKEPITLIRNIPYWINCSWNSLKERDNNISIEFILQATSACSNCFDCVNTIYIKKNNEILNYYTTKKSTISMEFYSTQKQDIHNKNSNLIEFWKSLVQRPYLQDNMNIVGKKKDEIYLDGTKPKTLVDFSNPYLPIEWR